MKKIGLDLGSMLFVAPAMPVLLVGADVKGKPNFLTVAWSGVACGEPLMLSIPIRHSRYTLKGVKEHNTFSVNVPSANMVKEADFCGIFSGSKVDKVKTCNFSISYGKVASAPFIEQCPVNLSCSVKQMLDLGSHVLVIGAVEEIMVSENCMTDGKPDVTKIKPFLYVTTPTRQYLGMGEYLGDAFSVGKSLHNSA